VQLVSGRTEPAGAYLPAAQLQSLHTGSARPLVYLPSGHSEQAVLLPAEKEPAVQSPHTVLPSRVVGANLPAGHSTHAPDAGSLPVLPPGQTRQRRAPGGEKLPVGQRLQLVASSPLDLPAGQAAQAAAGGTVPNLPAGQTPQCEAPVGA
jgi:hypothetical protein